MGLNIYASNPFVFGTMIYFIRHLSRQINELWQKRLHFKSLFLVSTLWVVGFIVAVSLLAGFVYLSQQVLTDQTAAFDQAVLLALYRLHSPLLSQIFLGVTALGEPLYLLLFIAVLSLILLQRQQWLDALICLITATGAIGLNIWLKELFGRLRPELWERVVSVDLYSYPSGHAMTALVIYGFLGYWIATHTDIARIWITIPTISIVTLIGLSRLYLGVHWPTDVIAGYAAGLVWLMACLLSLEVGYRWLNRRRQQTQRIETLADFDS